MPKTKIKELNTLDESITDTLKRDFFTIVLKIRFIIFPFSYQEKIKVLRDWEFFGPLLISLALIFLMSTRVNNKEEFLRNLYLVLFGGAFLVTINSKLLGGDGGIFLNVSILTYCMAPFVGAAAVSFILGNVSRMFILISSIVAYLWSCKCAILFMTSSIDKDKKIQAMIPVFLFYLYFAWFMILE